MAESVQIASLEGGELRVPESVGKRREVVLALPLSRMLAKMVRVPQENLEDPVGYATPVLKAMSPYPDDPLSVSCETICETEEGRVVLAAALPEGSAEDVAGALDESGLNVTRIDALPLGQLPAILERLDGTEKGVRLMLLIGGADCLSVFVLDDGRFSAVRAISPGSDVVRELMLCLLEAEEFGGDLPLAGVVTVGDVPTEGLEALAPVRSLGEAPDALVGITARSLSPDTINVLPESWREVLEETRFKHKMGVFFSVAGLLWLAVMAFLVGYPKYYRYKTKRLNDRPAQRALAEKVKEKKDQVEAVRAVSNHDYGALEAMRAVVSVMPPSESGIELSRWNFKRGDVLTFTGTFEPTAKDEVWKFSDRLESLRLSAISENEEDVETPYFTDVRLPNGIVKRTFDVRCSFKPLEEVE